MRYEVLDRPDFSIVRVQFDQPGESILCEASAMVAKDTAVQMQTQMQGGLLNAAKRKLLGGESIFQNTFSATAPGQSMWFAPAPEGDLVDVNMDGHTSVFMNSGAFLASAPTVQLDTKWGGTKGFFSGTGVFLLKADGIGPLFFSAYGGIHPVDVGPAGFICDTGHIVGFTGGLQYDVQRVGGLKSLLASGEGLVARFHGQGRLWMSTRNPTNLASFLQPFRTVQRRSN